MKTIVIMRHSKAIKSIDYTDFDRPLTQQGTKDAKNVAKKLSKMKFSPDIIYASSAIRTKQTAQILAKHLFFEEPIEYCDNFYNGNEQNYYSAILSTKNTFKNILLIGHNPTCQQIIYEFTGKNIQMKTSSALIMKFDTTEWSNCLKMNPKEIFLIEK